MADARRIARQRLESLARAGVTSLPKPKPPAKRQLAEVLATPREAARAEVAPPKVATAVGIETAADRNEALNVIRAEVAHCTRCKELCTTRKQTVFGVGNPMSRLVFLGEAPGADEDAQGEPFVGRAGQLLNKIIEACTLRREDVYILNILKCRPPDNRAPMPDESANCREYLEGQLDIIKPEYICCLGATAAKNLLNTEVSISKLRGKFATYRGIKVMCTYHPAYLLRNPAAKRDVWEDMKSLMRAMGIELDKKTE